MKIASVTPTYNSFAELSNYIKHINDIRDDLFLHIIVDNNSDPSFKALLTESFPGSVILFCGHNGGTTGAFNRGITYALEQNADAILLITTDMKLPKGSLDALKNLLSSSDRIGVVGPLLLKGEPSDVIESYGGTLNKYCEVTFNYCDRRLSHETDMPPAMEVDFICGGINLAKKEVYERAGLQDETLFMYGDENDWDVRVKKAGYKLVVCKEALAWHNHFGVKNRSHLAVFLSVRNAYYLVAKHCRKFDLLPFVLHRIFMTPRIIFWPLVECNYRFLIAYVRGNIRGVFNLMSNDTAVLKINK